jgi:hypothetical protein
VPQIIKKWVIEGLALRLGLEGYDLVFVRVVGVIELNDGRDDAVCVGVTHSCRLNDSVEFGFAALWLVCFLDAPPFFRLLWAWASTACGVGHGRAPVIRPMLVPVHGVLQSVRRGTAPGAMTSSSSWSGEALAQVCQFFGVLGNSLDVSV